MNENAEKWAVALESGNYQQDSAGFLRTDDGYCCLGVGCEISGQGAWSKLSTGTYQYFAGMRLMSCTIHGAIKSWLGLRTSTGEFQLTEEVKALVCAENDGVYPPKAVGVGDGLSQTSLVGLNDSRISFSTIAKVIRMEPPGLFLQPEKE